MSDLRDERRYRRVFMRIALDEVVNKHDNVGHKLKKGSTYAVL